jgi:hypothetical protein
LKVFFAVGLLCICLLFVSRLVDYGGTDEALNSKRHGDGFIESGAQERKFSHKWFPIDHPLSTVGEKYHMATKICGK